MVGLVSFGCRKSVGCYIKSARRGSRTISVSIIAENPKALLYAYHILMSNAKYQSCKTLVLPFWFLKV